MSNYKKAIFIFLSILIVSQTEAQQQVDGLKILHQIKVLNAETLGYDYTLCLINHNTSKILDKVSGKCYKYKSGYLDSNDAQINMRDEFYTLQIDNRHRIAYVKTLKTLEVSMKSKITNDPVPLLDIEKMVARNAINTRVSKNASGNTVVEVIFKDGVISTLTAELTPDMILKSVVLKSQTHVKSNTILERIMVIKNFTNKINVKLLGTDKYMIRSDNSFKLKAKFSTYKVTVLI